VQLSETESKHTPPIVLKSQSIIIVLKIFSISPTSSSQLKFQLRVIRKYFLFRYEIILVVENH